MQHKERDLFLVRGRFLSDSFHQNPRPISSLHSLLCQKHWRVGHTVYLLLYSGWTPENMYAKSRTCRCGDGQEPQSAKPLIITGGKCNVFWGCHCALHAGRRRSAKLNVAFCGCWQRRWRCAIGTCHSTLVWWLNKANRQRRQGERGHRKGRAEGRRERNRNSDRVGQKGSDTLGMEGNVFSIHSRKKNTISLDFKYICIKLSYIWRNVFYFCTTANSACETKATLWLQGLLSLDNSGTSSDRWTGAVIVLENMALK